MIEKAVGLLGEEPTVTGAAEAYFRLGWLHQVPLEDLEQAIADYSRAIELNPQDATAYNNRGNAYAQFQNYEQAIEADQLAENLTAEDAESLRAAHRNLGKEGYWRWNLEWFWYKFVPTVG